MAELLGLVERHRAKNSQPVVQDKIFITRTCKVSNDVMDAVASGIRLINDLSRPKIEVVDLRHWGFNEDPTKEYQSLDWYQSQALLPLDHGFGQQVATDRIFSLIWQESWQKADPHFEAMVVDRDLNMRALNRKGELDYINFCFGSTYPEFGFVISPIRILNDVNVQRYNVSREFLLQIIRKLAAHEYGHIAGLVARDHNLELSLGRHCAGEKGPCLMRQGLSLDVWIQQHLEEIKAKQEICPDCRDELVKGR